MNTRASWVLLLCGLLPAQTDPAAEAMQDPAPPAVINPFHPFDRVRFEAELQKLGAATELLATFDGKIAELGLARAADQLVRATVPAFAKAVELQEDNDPRAALELTKVLAATDSRVLQAHLRYHLAQVFLDSDDPESAMEVINDYLRENINQTPLDAEAAFYYAQSLAEVPLPQLALPRFRAFLQWFPEASERFRSAAHQQIQELSRQQDSRLHELADEMKKTRRDLRKQKTDKPVQLDQERYVEQLQELIEMYEEMEKQSSGPPSGNGPSSNPASQSGLPEGEGNVGNLQNRPSLADRWGDMKDRDRKAIEAQVQKNLPPQYRKMLEEYYKRLGAQGGSGR